ncbi:MAG: hypothetical protein WHS88_03300 [Anaerohalosphaeraceae bacterium]
MREGQRKIAGRTLRGSKGGREQKRPPDVKMANAAGIKGRLEEEIK